MVIYCFLALFFCRCEDLKGRLGASSTIENSKTNGVFISEYKPLTNSGRITDSINIYVGKVWLEKKWRYSDNLKSNAVEGYQMILESNKNDLKGFAIDWTIGIDFKKNWRFCSANNIMTDFDNLPSDTIIWKVQKGDNFDSLSKKKIIGEFILVKK